MSNLRRSGSFALSPKKPAYASPGKFVTPSTRRQSLNTSSGSILLEGVNNDEAEKREWKLNKLQQLQSRGVHSPTATPVDKRKSTSAFTGLTTQQITEHYATCIQLSAENKINIKNAFNLQLIDYMSELLKRKDSDMNNFQVASCTLDASTKIYGYRVDSVHTDTLKMAGGLGRTKDRPNEQDGATTEDHAKGKKKVKTKKTVTVETNLKNLDVVHFDLEFDVDPLFKKTATQFDEGRVGGGQFLNTLHIVDDKGQLVLDSETILVPLDMDKEQSSQTVVIPAVTDTLKMISRTFAAFEFTTWNLSDEEDTFRDAMKAHNDADPDLAFDMNAIPEPLENDAFEVDDYNESNDIHCDDHNDTDNRTVITIGGGNACHQAPPPQLEVIHLKDYLASNPLEYSYFDAKVMSAWAGPGHWKLKAMMKEKDSTKQSNKLKKKNPNEFTVDYGSVEIERQFAKLKSSTKIQQKTIKKWSVDNTTLPVDLHFDSADFFKLFKRSGVIIRKQTIKTEIEIKIEESEDEVPEIDGMEMGEDGSNYGDHTAVGYDETDLFSQTVFPSQPEGEKVEQKDFLGDNLVEAPNKVSLINIGYARTAKKIDMKKLKTSMWTLLSDSENNKENERNHRTQNQMDSKGNKNFSILYSDLHPRLPQKMAENLSVPLAFIALLHLANEHNLQLSSIEELGDFIISQG